MYIHPILLSINHVSIYPSIHPSMHPFISHLCLTLFLSISIGYLHFYPSLFLYPYLSIGSKCIPIFLPVPILYFYIDGYTFIYHEILKAILIYLPNPYPPKSQFTFLAECVCVRRFISLKTTNILGLNNKAE